MAYDTSLDPIFDAVPELAGRELIVEDLEGGLTNRNLKVVAGDRAYVVRLWSDEGSLLSIDRDNEHESSLRAAAVGVGAPVIAYLPTHNALVIEFIKGRTLSSRDLRKGYPLERVADAVRRLHSADAFPADFDMFEIHRTYLDLVTERGFRLPDRYREFEPRLSEVREALSTHPEERVPCHNDLLAENFIDDDERLRLIDYEYAGNNEPSFELGNIWSESNLSLDQLERLVASYYGDSYYGDPRPDMVARARLWGLMAKYGWTLWASIQDGVSDIDFDFWAWGMEKYERAVAEFESAELDGLLDRVRAGT
ncbi:MAG: phosphotransferase [Solirubrobacterales bacterium]|nr:phosphotransferase [Solirubrobacterales bacterium]